MRIRLLPDAHRKDAEIIGSEVVPLLFNGAFELLSVSRDFIPFHELLPRFLEAPKTSRSHPASFE